MAKRGTDKEVAENLRKVSAQLRQIAAELWSKFDDIEHSAHNIALYIADELDLMASLLSTDVRQFAWRTRNVYEAMLLFGHCTKSRENARLFIAQVVSDQKEILEGVLGLKMETQGERKALINRAMALAKEEKKSYEDLLSKYGVENAKPWFSSALATEIGMKKEHDFAFKLLSKYTHPTGWSINASPTQLEGYWPHLKMLAQQYADVCFCIVAVFAEPRRKKPD